MVDGCCGMSERCKQTHLGHSDSGHPHFEAVFVLCTKHFDILGCHGSAGGLDGEEECRVRGSGVHSISPVL